MGREHIFRQQSFSNSNHSGFLRLSTGFSESQSSVVGNSRFSTMDHLTMLTCAYGSKLHKVCAYGSKAYKDCTYGSKAFTSSSAFSSYLWQKIYIVSAPQHTLRTTIETLFFEGFHHTRFKEYKTSTYWAFQFCTRVIRTQHLGRSCYSKKACSQKR